MPYVKFLTEQIQLRIAQGELLPVDPGITARCYVGMVIACAVNAEFWNRLEGVNYETLEIVDNNVPIFTRGMKVNPED